MKKQTEQYLRKLIKEEIGNQNFVDNEKAFYRLPKKIIGNDLYVDVTALKSLYDYVSHGNDFKPEHLQSIIDSLNKVMKSAKKFKAGEEMPEEYK
jgi:hypothetical protein